MIKINLTNIGAARTVILHVIETRFNEQIVGRVARVHKKIFLNRRLFEQKRPPVIEWTAVVTFI